MPNFEHLTGWDIIQTLGEGSFGEVKLILNQDSMEYAAVKIIDVNKMKKAGENILKEICIHRMLKNLSIVQFYGHHFFREQNIHYIFLEYAGGGELFDRIEPDIGTEHHLAQKYFQEIIKGTEYLHTVGVAHRDLKPENILLDMNDHIKIADFGLATLFRYKGVERYLDKRCGTKPYVAPEVLSSSKYKAQPADIWSCGIILVALLTGELPWDQASLEYTEFHDWCSKNNYLKSPWNKIDNIALSLLKRILLRDPVKRYAINDIMHHRWFKKTFKPSNGKDSRSANQDSSDTLNSHFNYSQPNMEILRSSDKRKGIGRRDAKRFCEEKVSSMFMDCGSQDQEHDIPDQDCHDSSQQWNYPICFSQPNMSEELLLNSQNMPLSQLSNLNTQSLNHNPLHRLVKRMTRFVSKLPMDKTVDEISQALHELDLPFKLNSIGMLVISTVDKRKSPLTFIVSFFKMNRKVLVDFRLSRGDGLEFKKRFLKIKCAVENIIENDIPNL